MFFIQSVLYRRFHCIEIDHLFQQLTIVVAVPMEQGDVSGFGETSHHDFQIGQVRDVESPEIVLAPACEVEQVVVEM